MKKKNTNTKYIVSAVVAVVIVLGVAAYYGLGEQLQGRLTFKPTSNQLSDSLEKTTPKVKVRDIQMSDELVKLTPISYEVSVGLTNTNDIYDGNISVLFELPADTDATKATLYLGNNQISAGQIRSHSETERNHLRDRGNYPGRTTKVIGAIFDSSYLSMITNQNLKFPTEIEVEFCNANDLCKKTVYPNVNVLYVMFS